MSQFIHHRLTQSPEHIAGLAIAAIKATLQTHLISMFESLKSIFLGKQKTAQEISETVARSPVEEYNTVRSAELRHSFCYAPSVNMLFSQDGSVNACCHNGEFSIGSYPQQTISEIWHSEKAKEFRNYMQQFDLSHGCGICNADLQTRNYNEVRAVHFDKLPRNPNYPTMMEFLLSNTCNLECVMCQGKFSSLIRKNREKLPPLVSPYDDAFVEQLKEFIPYLRETRFSGSGEAFSIEMYYRIWDLIMEMNPSCTIMVQTNGTYLNARIKDYLQRGKFQIGVSLDSLKKELYEEIRVHANFDRVMESITYFHEYSVERKMKFNISTCVMTNNWQELPDFIRFANSMDAVATFHKVWIPEHYAPQNLSREELTKMYSYLSSFDFPADTFYQNQNREHYRYFVSVVEGWIADTYPRDEERERTSSLSEKDLMDYIQQKLDSYIRETISDDAERKREVEACMTKINMVTSGYEGKVKKEILQKISSYPAAKTVVQFSKNNIESLAAKTAQFASGKRTFDA